ncbi:MAG: DoxX family protein [Rhodobacteraceae bacterium]|nr:DoxX family protein [Paracoccaceae bacterium]
MFRFALQAIFAPHCHPSSRAASAMLLIARVIFASVLLRFFWNSFATKIDGFSLSDGAYYQILPHMFEAAGYDPAALAWPWHIVVLAGTLVEPFLPLLVVIGLATRPAALAMISFVIVMSLTDIFGHGVDAATVGAMFDPDPYGKILDQRLLWGFVLLVPAWLGGGAVSLDAMAWSRIARRRLNGCKPDLVA